MKKANLIKLLGYTMSIVSLPGFVELFPADSTLWRIPALFGVIFLLGVGSFLVGWGSAQDYILNISGSKGGDMNA